MSTELEVHLALKAVWFHLGEKFATRLHDRYHGKVSLISSTLVHGAGNSLIVAKTSWSPHAYAGWLSAFSEHPLPDIW